MDESPFFLHHELPAEKKIEVIKEANRVLKPGGKMVFGEFHKPRLKLLEFLGRIYFFVFEPYAIEMWDNFDFEKAIDEEIDGKFAVEKTTYLFDNFQVIAAERKAA